jgi:SAM-dependent methyltransferase
MRSAFPPKVSQPSLPAQREGAEHTPYSPGGGISDFLTENLTAAELYNDRFERFGRDIRTVGWSSHADQVLRFEVLFRGLEPKGKTILDVGCGLGDLVPFLQERTDGDFTYIGVDIAERLVSNAQLVHGGNNCSFLVGDAFRKDLRQVDIAVLSGALSLRTDSISEYAQLTLERMYALSREAACLNFLSKYVDYELEKNQHYQPETVFTWSRRIAHRVNLFHDYPLYEFTVQLLHQPKEPS